MYYINEEQIEERLQFIPSIVEGTRSLLSTVEANSLVHRFARERILQLAIETVTDVGSLMIDGFIMRDASSYEDIMEILKDEQVLEESLAASLIQLVKWRKPLVQHYFTLSEEDYLPIFKELPALLEQYIVEIKQYLKKELG